MSPKPNPDTENPARALGRFAGAWIPRAAGADLGFRGKTQVPVRNGPGLRRLAMKRPRTAREWRARQFSLRALHAWSDGWLAAAGNWQWRRALENKFFP